MLQGERHAATHWVVTEGPRVAAGTFTLVDAHAAAIVLALRMTGEGAVYFVVSDRLHVGGHPVVFRATQQQASTSLGRQTSSEASNSREVRPWGVHSVDERQDCTKLR